MLHFPPAWGGIKETGQKSRIHPYVDPASFIGENMKDIEPCGLYIISDQYFLDFPNERYMDNKKESRPHYYAIRDNDGIFWMIPLSSKVEK